MKIFIDTEYMEDGMNITLLSIGMVREDGETFYVELSELNKGWANDWVKANVLPTLSEDGLTVQDVMQRILDFIGEDPEFWGYKPAYDWVALRQLYGAKDYEIPGWPEYCWDVQQLAHDRQQKITAPKPTGPRNALKHALWVRDVYAKLMAA